MNPKFRQVGFYPADILLPKNVDMTKWAVVACDQFTSEPEYWEAVEKTVGDAPSALRLILPEAKLNSPDVNTEIQKINQVMQDYLDQDIFTVLPESLLYVERRQSDGKIRNGLIGMVDLDQYDFTPGSHALIRATEGTILSRIPPRVKVREDAPIELPHIMLLIDDPDKTVIEPLTANHTAMTPVYQFALQQGGGQISGWSLSESQKDAVADALLNLCSENAMAKKYDMRGVSPLLFAVGDGNHSLATAKQCYENLKKITPQDQWANLPARYALVEVVNNHDEALQFEPIHRMLFHVDPIDVMAEFQKVYPDAFEGQGEGHVMEILWKDYRGFYTIPHPKMQLATGTIQAFIDRYLEKHGGTVDYIHGEDVVARLSEQPNSMGFLLPPMGKEQLFKTVIADGVLPRKTFSMGHAQDKRYYVEARKIK